MRRFTCLLFVCCFVVGCDKEKPAVPTSLPEVVEVETTKTSTLYELGKYLPTSKPSFFILGDGNNFSSTDIFSDRFLFPGTRVRMAFSDASEGVERVETQQETCFANLDFIAEKADKTNYRLYLTRKNGDHQLAIVGTRVLWEVTGRPTLEKEEKLELLRKQPECAYYAGYVHYGLQNVLSISIGLPQFGPTNSDEFRHFSPGLVASSEDLSAIWDTAKDIVRTFKANGAHLSGLGHSAAVGGTSGLANFWKDSFTLTEAEQEMSKALAQDEGYLQAPIRSKIGFPMEVSGVAVEARVIHLLSPIDPALAGARLIGLGTFVPAQP